MSLEMICSRTRCCAKPTSAAPSLHRVRPGTRRYLPAKLFQEFTRADFLTGFAGVWHES
jgi:hypothetical protein